MADEKILQDEILSDEELENVAGGDYKETAGDSVFLSFYGLCKKYGVWEIEFDKGTSKEEDVKRGWAKLGVTLEYHGRLESGSAFFGDSTNKYFINGKEVSRDDAYVHALMFIAEHHGIIPQ